MASTRIVETRASHCQNFVALKQRFEDLFAATGFRLDRLTENPAGPSVVEAVPV